MRSTQVDQFMLDGKTCRPWSIADAQASMNRHEGLNVSITDYFNPCTGYPRKLARLKGDMKRDHWHVIEELERLNAEVASNHMAPPRLKAICKQQVASVMNAMRFLRSSLEAVENSHRSQTVFVHTLDFVGAFLIPTIITIVALTQYDLSQPEFTVPTATNLTVAPSDTLEQVCHGFNARADRAESLNILVTGLYATIGAVVLMLVLQVSQGMWWQRYFRFNLDLYDAVGIGAKHGIQPYHGDEMSEE